MVRLQPQLAAGLDTPAGLRKALQTAVVLEHAALVPYLYSLYSLSPDANPDVFVRVKPIVMQQMGHMALACNVLNAIGGSPAIDDPALVPTYPGPLPGGVETRLVVPLQAFSLDLVRQVFMEIEEPNKPLVLEEHARDGSTIADLYVAIGQRIMTLGESIFTGDPKRQVSGVLNVIEVTDRTSARIALETIVEQGQGTADSPTTAGGQLAHYYRFAEGAGAKPGRLAVLGLRWTSDLVRPRGRSAGCFEPKGIRLPGRLGIPHQVRRVQRYVHGSTPRPPRGVQRNAGKVERRHRGHVHAQRTGRRRDERTAWRRDQCRAEFRVPNGYLTVRLTFAGCRGRRASVSVHLWR
jgi:hypothetical protein